MRALAAPARIAAAALVLALASCGGDDSSPPPSRAASPPPSGGPTGVTLIGGEKLQSARCRQWRGASDAEKAAVVKTLAAVVGGPTPYGPASTLPAPYARRLFDRTCPRFYARGFLLYELYTRAAAFYRVPQRDL